MLSRSVTTITAPWHIESELQRGCARAEGWYAHLCDSSSSKSKAVRLKNDTETRFRLRSSHFHWYQLMRI